MHSAEDILNDKSRGMVCVAHDQTIFETLKRMVDHRIGAVFVKRHDEIVGIWTERDFLRNSLVPGFDPRRAQICDYMTAPVYAAEHTASLNDLMDMFLGLYVRHMLIKRNGLPIGMISIGDVVRANLLQKDKTIRELNSLASWHYYENWGWDRKKRP